MAVTEEEVDIANALRSGTALEWCVLVNRYDEVIDVVSAWAFMVGAPPPSAPELVVIAQSLCRNYPHLTTAELNLAANLTLRGELDIHFQVYRFSPLYASTVLNEYLKFKNAHVREMLDRSDRAMAKAESEMRPTAEEERDLFVQILRVEYEDFKRTGVVMDSLNVIYNHLFKTKRLRLTKAEIDAALEYGRSRYVTEVQEQAGESLYVLSQKAMNIGRDDEDKKTRAVKNFARKFTLQKFFSEINIDELVGTIVPAEFIRT